MICYKGERVTLTTGSPGLYTMGVSLARIFRFAGHTEYIYSVLAHSFVVASLMPPKLGVYGLVHDTPEVLVSDVPTPMKSQVARNREHALLQRIYMANGLPWPLTEEITQAIEEADHTALIAEAHVLKHPGAQAQWGTEYDADAAKLTKKYMKKTIDWLDADVAGPLFVKEFKKYANLAGLNDAGEWQ